MSHSIDPRTDKEWQEAVNRADLLIRLDAARQYGLLEGGPVVHVERCQQILARGKERGIEPNWDECQGEVRDG